MSRPDDDLRRAASDSPRVSITDFPDQTRQFAPIIEALHSAKAPAAKKAEAIESINRQAFRMLAARGYSDAVIGTALEGMAENASRMLDYAMYCSSHGDKGSVFASIRMIFTVAEAGASVEQMRLDLESPSALRSIRLKTTSARMHFASLLVKAGASKREAEQISGDVYGAISADKTIKPMDASNLSMARFGFHTVQALMRAAPSFLAAGLPSPNEVQPAWLDRDPTEFPTAESFLQRFYGPRLGLDGDLTITGLMRLDRELAEQLQADFAGRPERLSALLPTPTERANAKLVSTLGFVPTDPKERLNALSVISRGGRPGLRGPYRHRKPS